MEITFFLSLQEKEMNYDQEEGKEIDLLLTRNKPMESLMRVVSVFDLLLYLLNKSIS